MQNLEIWTPHGWSDFDGVKQSWSYGAVSIATANGLRLECTMDHLIETSQGFHEASQVECGDYIQTKYGIDIVRVVKIDHTKKVPVYDVLEVKEDNVYYTNGIVSHNCEFLGSSGTLIASSALKSLVYKDPISQERGMYQYETPREDRTYVIVADVSHGKGLDYSAASVIDVTEIPYKQVCVYRNNMITPSDYAEVLYRLGQTYNEAFLLVEVNDIGAQVADSIFHTYEYESLLFTEPAGPNGKRIAGGFGSRKIENGIRTTKSVKAIGCSMLKMLIERRQLIIKDFNTIHELSVFAQQTNGSYAAEKGHTDDIVMGLVLFGWMSNDPFFKEITEIDTMDSIREAGRVMEEDLLPFGIVYNGIGDRNDASDNVEVDGDGTVWKETSIF